MSNYAVHIPGAVTRHGYSVRVVKAEGEIGYWGEVLREDGMIVYRSIAQIREKDALAYAEENKSEIEATRAAMANQAPIEVNPPRAYQTRNGLVTYCPTASGKRLLFVTPELESRGAVTITIEGNRGGHQGSIRVNADTLRQALLLSGLATRSARRSGSPADKKGEAS